MNYLQTQSEDRELSVYLEYIIGSREPRGLTVICREAESYTDTKWSLSKRGLATSRNRFIAKN